MQKLVQGVHRFQAHAFDHTDLFRRLASGQNPQALFITCCDSRIVPHLIMEAEPGDLFILRTLGNLIPPYGASTGGEAATIEYAVGTLGIKDIIICGHTRCGAMQALLKPEALDKSPLVGKWLRHAEATKHIMCGKYGHLAGDHLWTATVEENVLVQLENIRTHPVVAAKLATGELKLHGWVLKIETGRLFAFDPEPHQFVPLVADEPAHAPRVPHLTALASKAVFERSA